GLPVAPRRWLPLPPAARRPGRRPNGGMLLNIASWSPAWIRQVSCQMPTSPRAARAVVPSLAQSYRLRLNTVSHLRKFIAVGPVSAIVVCEWSENEFPRQGGWRRILDIVLFRLRLAGRRGRREDRVGNRKPVSLLQESIRLSRNCK